MEANLLQNGPLSILKLQGRFFTESDREHAIEKLDLVENWNLVIDLSELEYINSTGIAFLVKTLTRSRLNLGDTVLYQPNAQLNKIFELTRMEHIFGIYQDLEQIKKFFEQTT
jgi:anti-anti-sigma factor